MKNVYVCRGCNTARSTHDGRVHCCSCDDAFCNDCSYITGVPKSCEGECIVGYGYVEDQGRDCKCHPNIKQIWQDCEEEHQHYVCDDCITSVDPDEVTKDDIIEYLLEQAKTSEEDVRSILQKKRQEVIDI